MFSELFATAPDAMIVVDRHGRIIRVNSQAERMFAYAEEELRGQPVEILIPEHVRQVHRLHRSGYVSNPRVRPMGTGQELVGLKKGGQTFPVEIALSPINSSGGEMFVASIRDISETQRARQALLRARYDTATAQIGRRLLIASNLEAGATPTLELLVSTLEIDGAAIATRNERTSGMLARALHGATAETIGELPWSLVLRTAMPRAIAVGDSPAPERAPINDPVLSGSGFNSTLVFPLFDREEPTAALIVLSREWREFDRDSIHFLESVANMLAAAMQRIRSEDQLSHAQRLEAIGQLTGGVAHDFNNLLTIIAGNLQILEDRLAASPTDREIIATALRAASRGTELTRKLLSFARRQRLSPRACDPKAFLDELGRLLQRTLGETILVNVEHPQEMPLVFADPAHLDSALMNLALNSRDSMPLGGTLTIAAATKHLGVDEGIEDLEPGDYVEFVVRDTGSGMSPEVLARAFEPFFTTKEHGKGSGLGLSMVYGFVKQSGGRLTVESQPGYGTSIGLCLPAAGLAQPSVAAGPATTPDRGRETILVVEDEPDVRGVAVVFLRSLGYAVRAVANAEEALEVLAGGDAVAMVFSDIVLGPGMTGRDLAREIQRLRPGIAILLTSGYSSSPDPEIAGAPYEVLQKPYLRAELAVAIRRALDHSRSARSESART